MCIRDSVYASEDLNPEDFYADEDMVITISHLGYIKRTPLSEFRTPVSYTHLDVYKRQVMR